VLVCLGLGFPLSLLICLYLDLVVGLLICGRLCLPLGLVSLGLGLSMSLLVGLERGLALGLLVRLSLRLLVPARPSSSLFLTVGCSGRAIGLTPRLSYSRLCLSNRGTASEAEREYAGDQNLLHGRSPRKHQSFRGLNLDEETSFQARSG